jgi:AraC-like DNA-binding protein
MAALSQNLVDIVERQLALAETGELVLHILGGADSYASVEGHHFHPAAELFIQLSGVSCMQNAQNRVRCYAGECMLVPRGIPHDERVGRDDRPFRNVVLAFGRRTLSIHEAQEGRRARPGIVDVEQFISDDVGRLCGYLDAISEWRRRDAGLSGTAQQGLLMAFFALLLDNVRSPESRQRGESLKVVQCRRMVSEHLVNSDLSVKWLAQRIACAPDYLSTLFRRETGFRLTRYINDKRIAFAVSLLEGSVLNIEQVAYACGYRDPGYMTRQFRQRNDCTPRAYRNRARG